MAFLSFSQSPTDYRVINYDETSGLSSRLVTCLLFDKTGFMWIGTVDGLCRYDGYSFKIFRNIPGDSNSITHNYITKLAQDKENNIWIGYQRGGVSCYNTSVGKFTNYTLKNKQNSSLSQNGISMIYADNQDEIWLGVFQNGLVHLDKKSGATTQYNIITDADTFYTKEFRKVYNNVYSAYEDKNGLYWLATHDGFYSFDKEKNEMHSLREAPLQTGTIRNDLFGLIVPDGTGFWLGSWAGGLAYYDTVLKKWSAYKFSNKSSGIGTVNIISGIKYKSKNELWITSNDKGLGIFNTTEKKFFFFSDSSAQYPAFPGTTAYGVEKDSSDNIWVIHLQGLSKIHFQPKRFIYTKLPVTKTDNGEFYELSSYVQDKDYNYIGTSLADGLHVVNRKTGEQKIYGFNVMAGEEPYLNITDILKDSKENIWVLTRDFIYRFDKNTASLKPIPQPPAYTAERKSNFFSAAIEDKKGNVWIATRRNGVFVYNPVTQTYLHYYSNATDTASLTSNVVGEIAIDKKDRIWIAGARGCLAYFDETKKRFIDFFPSLNRDIKIQLSNHILSLHTDSKGYIWAGTDDGLIRIDGNAAMPVFMKLYTAADGLKTGIVSSIEEDAYGNIWCITMSSLCMFDPVSDKINSYGYHDGITTAGIGTICIATDDKKMILLSSAGYYTFNPNLLEQKSKIAPVVITSFKVNDQERFFEEELRQDKVLHLKADENFFSFEFAALDFNRPDNVHYVYMLEGFDKGWQQAGSRRFASYTNIPGGDYVFKVKAISNQDEANSAVISIPILIDTPFFKTWWFIILTVLIIFAGMFAFYSFRLKKQQQILELETKAQALGKEKSLVQYETLKQQLNPHFLFNSLTSLSSLIRIDQKLAGNFLDGMSKIYRYILQSKDHEIVPLNDEIRFIQTYIQLQKTRFEEGLQINLNVSEENLTQKIVPVTLQNLIDNAIKHNIIDQESPLVIDIFTQEDYLVVRNRLQKKNFVETSNKQGLDNLKSLYRYLSDKPVIINEDAVYFTVKIPLI
ncbi:MAG: two-component regulator propeller domain-containing protein [Panacibacter sp.]